MVSNREYNLGAALSAVTLAAMLVAAGAGSTAALAQTSALQAPASAPRFAPRTGLGAANTPSSSLASPVAAPLAAPMGQTGLAPAIATPHARVGATSAVAKKYVLKAHVVPGATLNAGQKLATASAALAELARQAQEQADKETVDKIAQLQKTLNIGNSATLSLLSPKSPIGNATLSLTKTDRVDFEKNQVQFNAGTLKLYGDLLGWPAAYCHFTVPEDGFYMVAFTLKIPANVGGTTSVTAGFKANGWDWKNEAKAVLNKGVSIVAIVGDFRKGEVALSRITSDKLFDFNSCEISRLK